MQLTLRSSISAFFSHTAQRFSLRKYVVSALLGTIVAAAPVSPVNAQSKHTTVKKSKRTAIKHTTKTSTKKAKVVQLTAPDITLYARLLQMQDRRALDTALIRTALASHSSPVRAEAAFVLAQVAPAHRTEVAPMLTTLSTDRDTVVAANAAFGVKFLTHSTPYDTVSAQDTVVTHRTLASYDSVVRSVVMPTLAGKPPQVLITTAHGSIRLVMVGLQAPLTVANFLALVRRGFYDGLTFHRVEPGFVVQGGDPTGTGAGGVGYSIHDEFNREPYTRGAVGIATSGPDTGGCQYFMTLQAAQAPLDGRYTLFGRVASGLEAMDALQIGDKMIKMVVQ